MDVHQNGAGQNDSSVCESKGRDDQLFPTHENSGDPEEKKAELLRNEGREKKNGGGEKIERKEGRERLAFEGILSVS